MSKQSIHLWVGFILLLSGGLIVLGLNGEDASAGQAMTDRNPFIEVEPGLQEKILVGDDDFGYMIYFGDRPDLTPAYEMSWEDRGRFVVEALQNKAEESQHRVRAYLEAQGVIYQSFWVDNVIVVQHGSNKDTFYGLMRFPEIEALRKSQQLRINGSAQESTQTPDLLNVEPNLIQIGADQVWGMGYTGEGITVANIDTGVQYTHEALVNQYRGNLGSTFDHNYNWWDTVLGGTSVEPYDHHAHGTGTMGIALGATEDGYHIGVAPGANWIACQISDSATSLEYLECGQFLLAPWDLGGKNPNPDLRPHVVNNSWGDSVCLQVTDPWYKGVVTSWLAAGIYPVFANGNREICGNIYPPINTVLNPARYGNVTGVGSSTVTGVYTDTGDYATHSSWGPTDDEDQINSDGFAYIKPQVVAPGVGIRSATKFGDDEYATFIYGTSFAAPHVTGLIALLWDAAPCLIGDYATTEMILQETARPIYFSTGLLTYPNYATGWGQIDAVLAIQAALEVCPIYTTPRSQKVCRPGDRIFVIEANDTLTDPVSMSLSGLPTGVSWIFSPDHILPPGSSVLTTSVSIAAEVGDYPLEIQGLSGVLTYTDTVRLEIQSEVPGQPSLVSPLDEALNVLEHPELYWNLDPNADSYLLEIALDSEFSTIVYTATMSTPNHKVEPWLSFNTDYYWRVIPENICGAGVVSDVFKFRTRTPPPILLVDDDDNRPNVLEYYTNVLDAFELGYSVWDTYPMGFEPDEEFLNHFDIVIWFTGHNFSGFTGPDVETEADLGSWLDTGKCLLISSQDWQYVSGVTPFMNNYLGVSSVKDYILHEEVIGVGPVFENLGSFSLDYPFENYSDSMTPITGTDPAFLGEDMDDPIAGVSLDTGIFKSTYWGYPFEAIPTLEDRQSAMSTFLVWCLGEKIYLPIISR